MSRCSAFILSISPKVTAVVGSNWDEAAFDDENAAESNALARSRYPFDFYRRKPTP